MVRSYKLITKGLKYDMVSKLAYMDGLTGLGNRTAYLEAIDAYVEEGVESLAVVYLDINNLKVVNDTMGHEQGDILIKTVSEIIQNSYGNEGKTYRIGGDEFCVFLEGDNLNKRYKERTEIFEKNIERENSKKSIKYNIQIAHGFSILKNESSKKDCIEKMIIDADKLMYDDKRRLKEMAIKNVTVHGQA